MLGDNMGEKTGKASCSQKPKINYCLANLDNILSRDNLWGVGSLGRKIAHCAGGTVTGDGSISIDGSYGMLRKTHYGTEVIVKGEFVST